jgi:hypothetical protein
MITWGFTRLASESCIYYRKSKTGTVIAGVHVDDYLSIASSKEENEAFKAQMKKVWNISDLGTVKLLVGIAVEWDRPNCAVMLSQSALINRVVAQFGQKDANPTDTPMDPSLKLRRVDRSTLTSNDIEALNRTPYRSLVGCLLYIAIGTQPDIAYAVQQLSQFLDNYPFIHWHAAVRVIRYLKGTKNLKLHLGGNKDVNILGYTDSDWANCLDTRRSIGGYTFSLGSGTISWAAKKQKTVAASSCEAEYIAAFEASKEAIWLRALLTGINISPTNPTRIMCDNNASINLSEDPMLHTRVKHININYHFLRERAQSKEISLSYVKSKENAADIFTKPLERHQFIKLRNYLGVKTGGVTGEEEC